MISKAQPRYPPSAKRFNISGTVDVQVTISEAGRVTEAKAISGHPLLRGAAEECGAPVGLQACDAEGRPGEDADSADFRLQGSSITVLFNADA